MSRIRLQHGLQHAALAAGLCAGLLAPAMGRAAETKAPPAQRPLFPENEVGRLLPKEDRKRTDKIERLAPDGSLNGVADLPMFMTPNRPTQPRTTMSREQLEELDKKKNWMFVDPKTASKDASADKMLGVREEKSPEEEQREYKSLMERHLEKGAGKAEFRDKDDSDGDSRSEKDDPQSRQDARANNSGSFFILPGDAAKYGGRTDAPETRAFGTKPTTTATGLYGAPAAGTPGLGVFPGSTGTGRSSFLPDTSLGVARTDSQKEWAAEFKQMLNGKAPSGGFGRGSEPTGWMADPSKQSLNPVIGVRPDPYARPSATTPSATGFALPARTTGFDSLNRTPSFSDNNSSIFSSPTPSAFGVPAATGGGTLAPRPGSFQELPKRKF